MEPTLRTVPYTIVPYLNMCNPFPFQHSASCDTVFAGGGTMTIEEAFSKALKEARKEMGITQQKAAELCKLSVREFGNIERGTSKPGMDTIIQIYNVFGVSVYELNAELPVVPSIRKGLFSYKNLQCSTCAQNGF